MHNLKIPLFAKHAARRGLTLKRNGNGSVDVERGIKTADLIINNDYISHDKSKVLMNFYLKYRTVKTRRVESLMLMWGSRRFLKNHILHFAKNDKK